MPARTVSRREALAALAAAWVAPAALADLPAPPPGSARYHVELVVFRQPGPPPTAKPTPAEPLAPGNTIPGRVLPLPESDWQLASAAAALARRGYALLAHSAWFAIVPPNGRTTAHLEDLLPADSTVAGAVAVQRGQYLYVGVDLDYRPADTAAGGDPAPVYSLHEKRRVKYGERHYFDNPVFGAIVTIGNPHAPAGA